MMAVYDTTRANVAGLNLGGRVSYILTHLVSGFFVWNQTRQTKKVLSQLSNRELEDIGITRADLDKL